MKKRYLFPLLILFLLGIGGYYTYTFLQKNSGKGAEAMNFVPKDAVFVLETEEPIQNWKEISNSEPWDFLINNSFYKELSKSANRLNEMIKENEQLFGDFGSRKILISAHVYKPTDYDYLFIVDLKNISKTKSLIIKLIEEMEGYKVTKRTHKDTEVFSLVQLKGNQTLYISFVDNFLICSYTHSLVEKSIEQNKEPRLSRDLSFVEVEKKVSGDGMFRLYINYNYLDDFMRVYTKSNDSYFQILSNSLKYSGLKFNYDASNSILLLNGHSTLTPNSDSYLSLLQKQGGSKIGFASYVSKRAALVTAMNVAHFGDFYDALEERMKNSESEKYTDYEKKIRKIERFLKISVKEDFISWIDNELTFVHTQPVGLGIKNEYALFVKSKSGSEAKEKLDKICKQIKRRTPIKFKGIDYKGFTINFLSVKGLFKLMMGDFFGKIEKPYYTIIDDYVIFSNHPQTIKNVINDYTNKETLENSEQFKTFSKNFNENNSILIYANMPLAQNGLKEFLDKEALADVAKNKPYFEAFPHFCFQITSEDNGFDTRISIDYQNKESIVKIKEDIASDTKTKTNNGSMSTLESTSEEGDSVQLSIKAIEDAALIQLEDIILEDLDAKTQEENYDSGELKFEVSLKNGLKDGNYTEYSKTGKVIVKGSFKRDLKIGVWKFYNEKGDLISKKKF